MSAPVHGEEGNEKGHWLLIPSRHNLKVENIISTHTPLAELSHMSIKCCKEGWEMSSPARVKGITLLRKKMDTERQIEASATNRNQNRIIFLHSITVVLVVNEIMSSSFGG